MPGTGDHVLDSTSTQLFTKYLALDGKENVVWEQIGKPSNDLVSRRTSLLFKHLTPTFQ